MEIDPIAKEARKERLKARKVLRRERRAHAKALYMASLTKCALEGCQEEVITECQRSNGLPGTDPWPLCITHWFMLARWLSSNADELETFIRRGKDSLQKEVGVVYFIQRDSDNAIKIGTTTQLEKRVATLTREHGPLVVFGTIPGGTVRERQLHRELERFALGHEWFTDALMVRQRVYQEVHWHLCAEEARRRKEVIRWRKANGLKTQGLPGKGAPARIITVPHMDRLTQGVPFEEDSDEAEGD